jgi:hypothetical protein
MTMHQGGVGMRRGVTAVQFCIVISKLDYVLASRPASINVR